jgi:lipopolysaccharide biosynthesis glycosyltransferase
MADRAGPAEAKGSVAAPVPTSLSTATRFAGAVDHVAARAGLRGWALDVTAPGEAVELVARAAGRLLGRTLCLLDRPDIDVPAGRPTHCGFLLGWSRLDRAALDAVAQAMPDAEVTLEIATTGQPLPWACPPLPALELLALLEQAPRGDRQPAFAELNAALDIVAAGQFDAAFYVAREGARFAATLPPLLDYLRRGEPAGAWPHAGFDPAAHARAQGLPGPAGALVHALARGLAPPPPPCGEPPPPCAAREAERAAARQAREPGLPGAEARLALHASRQAADDLPGAAAAAKAALASLPALPEAARGPALEALAGTARALHAAGDAAAALSLDRALLAAGAEDEALLCRLLEAEVAARDLAAAASLAERLEARKAGALSVWSRVALSRFHEAAGRPARARALLDAVPRDAAAGDAGEAAVLHRLIDLGALEAAEARLADPAAAPGALAGPRLRLAARRMDLGALQALLTGPGAETLADWQLAEAMFRLTAPGRIDQAGTQGVLVQLHRLMRARGLGERSLVMARIHYLQQSKRWEELGRLFAELDATPLANDRETLRRRLEYHSYADEPEAAERIRRAHFDGVALDRWEGIAVLRLLGHTGRWAEAGRVLLDHLSAGHGFGAAAPMALRVVRRAGLHGAVLALPAAAGAEAAEIDAFRDLVARDHALAHHAEAGAHAPRHAGDWLLPAPAPPAPEDSARAVFLCSNERYFLSLLTFLCSFLGQAPQTGARLIVFLDADVPAGWIAAIAAVGKRFGRAIEVVAEADYVPPGVHHREAFGFFAAGNDLARTAYFRLYAARHLLARGGLTRAIYLDTDIVCRGDLSGMFALDLGDALLAAAVEDISPEVIHAAERNRLDPWQYVNSGALLLRMDDPRLAAAIEEAIRVAEREPERLVFHDQCAINIAFRARMAPLPPRYNFFLRPSRARNGHIEEGVLLHFLDKPKPWDIAFDRPYREEWRVWALFLAALLPEGQFLEMLAAANRE